MRTTLVVAVGDPKAPSEIAGLCDRLRLLLERNDPDRLVYDLAGITAPDAVTVDALARLQLTARRHGCRAIARGPSPELRSLLDFVGLGDLLAPESGLQAQWNSEEREELGSVEEECDPADPPP